MRYYYTDPLAAAWMTKHFGMDYEQPEHFDINWNDAHTYCSRSGNWAIKNSGGRLYIHPDSLRLLEPAGKDVILIYDPETDMVWPDIWSIRFVDHPLQCVDIRNGQCDDFKGIIQRDGILFMWPEHEEA